MRRVAETLRITDLLGRKPSALSGGDMQRVAIGRALVRRPKAILMDEPIGALDAKLREAMRAEIKRLHIKQGSTTIYVTHDQVEAMSLADRIVIMHEGVLQQVGSPSEVYSHPANLFVAQFVGSPVMNVAEAMVSAENGGAVVTLAEGAPKVFAFRPSSCRNSMARPPAASCRSASGPKGCWSPMRQRMALCPSRRISSSRSDPSTSSTSRSAPRCCARAPGAASSRRPAIAFLPASTRRRRISSIRRAAGRSASGCDASELTWPISSSRTSPRSSAANTALQGLDLDIADGEFFVLLGETGAGKTTTLRLIAGLEKPTDGKIFIDGIDVGDWGAAERDVALVLQQYSLYPRYTVRENLEFPLKSKIRRVPDAEIKERVARVAKTLRIEHLLDRKTDKLSGGEMQRVSIGRAIVRKPRVFLMDEPLSALDAKLREALRTELKNLQMGLGATFLFVTHDQIEAMSMGDKIGVLDRGRLVQTGTPNEIYNNPRNTFVARSVGSPPMNLLDGKLSAGRVVVTPTTFELPYSGAPGASVEGRPLTFGIRPEDVVLESGAAVEARVHDVENHGVEKILTLRVGDLFLHATAPARTEFAIDEAVRLSWNPAKVVLFDQASGVSLRHSA